MSDQATDNAQTAEVKFVPIEISAELLQKLIEKDEATEALEKQSEALHEGFWDEVCEAYGLDRSESWMLDKQYLESGVVMLKKKDCCGICESEGGMPDILKKMLGRALSGAGNAKTDVVKEVAG